MTEKNSLNLGLVFGDIMLLSAFAEQIGADLNKLARQASRCRALIDVGGISYINVPLFLQKRQAAQEARDEAREKRKSDPALAGTIETTTKVGLLRGQITRITGLNVDIQLKLEKLRNLIDAETDPEKRSDLETDQGNLMSRLESNKETISKAQKRLEELGKNHKSDITEVDLDSGK